MPTGRVKSTCTDNSADATRQSRATSSDSASSKRSECFSKWDLLRESTAKARLLRAAIALDGPDEPTEDDWDDWVELASRERVLPLLYKVAASMHKPRESLLVQATAVQLDVMATMVQFEHELLLVSDILSKAGVEFAVLKGAATSHLDYFTPELRQFGDIDLLVSPRDFHAVTALLGEQGWAQAYPLPRHHERFTHAVTLRSANAVEVDLHQRIAHRAIGELVRTQDLLANTQGYEIAGKQLQSLSREDRLIHAAIHSITSRGPYSRLSSTADVLVLADAAREAPQAALERADSFRITSLMLRAVESAYAAAQLPLPTAWLQANIQSAGGDDRLTGWAYLSPARRPAIEELAYLRLMRGWRNRYDYVRGYFTTDADYSARRHRSGLVDQSKYLLSRLRSR